MSRASNITVAGAAHPFATDCNRLSEIGLVDTKGANCGAARRHTFTSTGPISPVRPYNPARLTISSLRSPARLGVSGTVQRPTIDNGRSHHMVRPLTICAAVLALFGAGVTVHAQSWSTQNNDPKRFKVLGQFNNEAVLDNETGLVWERSPSTAKYAWNTWLSAHIWCNTRTIGGRFGWKV